MRMASNPDFKNATRLLGCLGYSNPTSLQRNAVDTRRLFSNENMLIIGETSSGKTLVPLLAYYDRLVQTPIDEAAPKLLFVVPYRALAAQKQREVEGDIERLAKVFSFPSVRVEQSTGEYRQADQDIFGGDVDVAIIITEKAFRFAANDASFLSRYDYLVIDELGLIDDAGRGTRVDFMLMWSHAQHVRTGRPRVFGLATPSYSWDCYVESYGLIPVTDDGRPIPLEEHVVSMSQGTQYCEFTLDGSVDCGGLLPVGRFYYPKFVKRLESKNIEVLAPCAALGTPCPVRTTCRSQPTKKCAKTGEPCSSPATILPSKSGARLLALERICRHHLGLGHQILIFKNDREEVRSLCRHLYERLGDVLLEPSGLSECKDDLLRECGLTEDDLYGIMEDANPSADSADVYYRAFAAGIGFHSRAMPSELRAYVEERLLESRSLRIVCCTETLAFGVNSTVDVVVVADIMKQDNASTRRLTANEYRNYTGRAGRLNEGRDKGDVGYVYTLLSGTKRGRESFAELMSDMASPQELFCSLYGEGDDALPLFVLNLIHSDGGSLTHGQIVEMTESLPIREEAGTKKLFAYQLGDALRELEKEGLVASEYDPFTDECRWGLTALGDGLSGYTVYWSDFERIKMALKHAFRGLHEGMCIEELALLLLGSRHMQSSLSNSFVRYDIMSLDDLRSYFRRRAGDKGLAADWLTPLKRARTALEAKLYYMLAALLCWSEGESSKALVRSFGIQYPLIQSMGQQLDYLLNIAERILPKAVREELEERREANPLFARVIGANQRQWDESVRHCTEVIQEQLRGLSVSLFYGIDPDICGRFINYLNVVGGEDALELAERVGGKIDPMVARTIRRLVVRYRFFASTSRAMDEDVEVRNNYLQQRSQYERDIQSMGHLYDGFFLSEHPTTYRVD